MYVHAQAAMEHRALLPTQLSNLPTGYIHDAKLNQKLAGEERLFGSLDST